MKKTIMIDFGDLIVFIRIVETGSLTNAGELLNIPKSTISRKITRLEDHLGVKLLHRTTRSVTVTDDGALFYEYCARSIGVLRDGERAVQSKQKTPQGVIKLALPYFLERGIVAPLVTEFLEKYPDVRMVAALTDDPVARLKSGFDLAVTPGPLTDSTLIATKLGDAPFGIYASPLYLERAGTPQSHIDLSRFDLLASHSDDRRETWTLQQGERQLSVEFKPKFVCNDLTLLRHAALAGLGIASLPSFICKHDLARGELVEVLPGSQTLDMSFFAVFSDHQAMPARIRALIDFFVAKLRKEFSWTVNSQH